MSGRASWQRRPRSNRPHKSVSPTLTCAPAAGHATRAAGPITTCSSKEFAAAIREQFPGCPVDRAEAIALHAAARGSGRVGRSAAGRALDSDAVRLAVVASVRHVDTDYDALLMSGVDRESARAQVHDRVEDVVNAWRDGVAMLD